MHFHIKALARDLQGVTQQLPTYTDLKWLSAGGWGWATQSPPGSTQAPWRTTRCALQLVDLGCSRAAQSNTLEMHRVRQLRCASAKAALRAASAPHQTSTPAWVQACLIVHKHTWD